MLDRSQQLVDIMVTKRPEDISALMSISPALGTLNHDRFQDWQLPLNRKTARPALVAFNGAVYAGMNARGTFTERDFTHAQKSLRILSGLYGVLKPLDLMLPYRLEMGTKLDNPAGKDLYAFWGDTITKALQDAIVDSPGANVLINLASQEYFGSVRPKKLEAPVINVSFLDGPQGDEKIIGFFAKRARGAMAGWMIRERITTVGKLPNFNAFGYSFDAARSTKTHLSFVRGPQ